MSRPASTGFTLIEVVLVLAIGGLIFLLAFLAFAQVQKNKRNTQRKSDAVTVLSLLQEYALNHNGNVPCGNHQATTCYRSGGASYAQGENFLNNYLLVAGLKNPSTREAYRYEGYGPTTSITSSYLQGRPYDIFTAIHAKCLDGSTLTTADSTNNGDVAVWAKLEGGHGYCVDNS